MDNLAEQISLWGVVSLAVTAVVFSAFVRKLLAFAFPSLRVTRKKDGLQTITVYASRCGEFYHEIGLYLIPYILAPLFALSKSTFLFGSVDRYGGKLLYAFLAVTFSGLLVKVVKKKLPALFGVELADDSPLALPEDE